MAKRRKSGSRQKTPATGGASRVRPAPGSPAHASPAHASPAPASDATGGHANGGTRNHPLPDVFRRPPITDYVNPLPLAVRNPRALMTQDQIDADRRVLATNFFLLPVICRESACRRARQCSVRTAPCIFRYKHIYMDFAPEARRMIERLSGMRGG